jgi:uncharacterized membrane protein
VTSGSHHFVTEDMVGIVKGISGIAAVCCEFTALAVIVVGALQALGSMLKTLVEWKTQIFPHMIFRGFAGWLVLALEFLLAADILRTAISPTWTDIGQLAAIAVIRTFLNYSLSHDLRSPPAMNET